MTAIARRGRGARRRVLGALAVAAVLTTVVTVGVRPTFASWVTTANLGQSVGVASSTCTTPGVYRTTASSRFLAGSVAGVPLTSSSALSALTATNPASSATFSSGATPRGGDGASTAVPNSSVANAVQAAGGIAGLAAPSGSQTLFAAATSTGKSVAGAGSVTTAGAVDTVGIAGGTSPAVGAVDVSAALGAIPGGTAAAGQLSQLGLTIGNAASVENLNECARRWGASLSTALSRTTTLSALSLSTKDAALSTLLTSVGTQRGNVATAFSDISGTDATSTAAAAVLTTAKTGLTSAVSQTLSALGSLGVVGVPAASVSIASNLAPADAAATGPAAAGAGLVTIDGGSRTVTTDLSKLASLSSPAPNTSLLTSADVTSIASGTSTAAASLVSGVTGAWDTATAGTRITVTVAVPVTLAGIPLLNVSQTMSGPLSDFLSGTKVWPAPSVQALGALDAGTVLATLVPKISTLLLGPVQTTVASAVNLPLTTAVTTAKTALDSALTTAQTALPIQLATLAGLFSVTLNEQPDVAPYPTAAPGIGGGSVTTALRVHVRVAGADALDLAVASTSVGPDTTVNQ